MEQIKLTKNSLRDEQHRLDQLQKYLPTLQLKKAMLQLEVTEAKTELSVVLGEMEERKEEIKKYSSLFSNPDQVDILEYVQVEEVQTTTDNIAGVEFPVFQAIKIKKKEFFLFDQPVWFSSALLNLFKLIELREKAKLVEEKKQALENELRNVSIRVNLFDKVLIPRAITNIKKIKIFLQDQYLSAVSQAKVAKEKILKKAKI